MSVSSIYRFLMEETKKWCRQQPSSIRSVQTGGWETVTNKWAKYCTFEIRAFKVERKYYWGWPGVFDRPQTWFNLHCVLCRTPLHCSLFTSTVISRATGDTASLAQIISFLGPGNNLGWGVKPQSDLIRLRETKCSLFGFLLYINQWVLVQTGHSLTPGLARWYLGSDYSNCQTLHLLIIASWLFG